MKEASTASLMKAKRILADNGTDEIRNGSERRWEKMEVLLYFCIGQTLSLKCTVWSCRYTYFESVLCVEWLSLRPIPPTLARSYQYSKHFNSEEGSEVFRRQCLGKVLARAGRLLNWSFWPPACLTNLALNSANDVESTVPRKLDEICK
jgi:hypothetical protein